MKSFTRKGFGIVETLVAMSIFLILMLGSVSAITGQNKESRALGEVLAVRDFQQALIRNFADGTVCSEIVTRSPLTLNSGASSTDLNLSITSIPTMGTGGGVFAQAGQPVSAISNRVLFATQNSFQLVNLTGSVSAGRGTFAGYFQVNLNQTNLVRPLKAPSVRVTVSTTGAGTVQTLVSCHSTSAPTTCRTVRNVSTEAPAYASVATCDTDEYLQSGGGKCDTSALSLGCGLPTNSLGVLHTSTPSISGDGWIADCFKVDQSGEACSEAWAICCKR